MFPFIPLSAYSVYFGALLHHRGLTEPEKENISPDFQSNDTAAGSCFLRFSGTQQKTKKAEGSCFKRRSRGRSMPILFNETASIHTLDWNKVTAFNQTPNNLHNVSEERMTAGD